MKLLLLHLGGYYLKTQPSQPRRLDCIHIYTSTHPLDMPLLIAQLREGVLGRDYIIVVSNRLSLGSMRLALIFKVCLNWNTVAGKSSSLQR